LGAKRSNRLGRLDRPRCAPVSPRAALGGGSAASSGASSTGSTLGTAEPGGAGLLADLSNLSEPSDVAVERLTEAVLKKIGVEPWVEIAPADAIETVPETTETSAVETVTKYRLNLGTGLVESYTAQETVKRQTPTGNMVKRLKAGVRFDETTGKAYRWCGLGGATPTETSAALLKQLLPAVAPAQALCKANP
jgi:hypothetical protein